MPESKTFSVRAMLLVLLAALGAVVGASAASPDYEVLHGFDSPPGVPIGELIEGSDGALYGTTQQGGAFGLGIVFKVNPDGTGYTRLHEFSDGGGGGPEAGLVRGSDGALYGTTAYGGELGSGFVFKIQEDGTGYTKLHEFDYFTTGTGPSGTLLAGGDGNLYGTTIGGGQFSQGVIFRITEAGAFNKLHDFDGSGYSPRGALMRGRDGALYGTAQYGGAFGQGVVFRISDDGSGFQAIHDFDYTKGSAPLGGLAQGMDGMYGATSAGGAFGYGTVFKMDETGSLFVTLHEFESADGARPAAALTVGSDGAFYGTSLEGGDTGYGVVYRITEQGVFLKLHDFDENTGNTPWARLLSSGSGDLIGATAYGGSIGSGVVFSITEGGSFTTILELGSSEGEKSYGPLARGSDGALYGTTSSGGRWRRGVVFKINEDGSGFLKLHDFDGLDGRFVQAGLVKGSDGAFYGVAQRGGTSDNGVVFRMTEEGTYIKLHDFDGTDGSDPRARLLALPGGTLYGTTDLGGTFGYGVLFKITEGGSFTKILDFDYTNGAYPGHAGLTEGSDGALYGITIGGLKNGVVFRLALDGTYTKLYEFDSGLAAYPLGTLLATGGRLFGTTYGGGEGYGVIFRIAEDGSSFTVLQSFDDGTRGSEAYAGLTRGSDGRLYGTTFSGGSNGAGLVYRIGEDGTPFTPLHSFDPSDGASPYSSVIEGSNGVFYGTTTSGGPGSSGVIFRLEPLKDSDGDGVPDSRDNCPVPNPDQSDADYDGVGDACDDDDDEDGVLDGADNCPVAYNPDQANHYGGPGGDACDDADGDGHLDAFDNCPLAPNPDQSDRDLDGVGDACDEPLLSISDAAFAEGHSGFTNATFVVSLFPARATPVTVQYRTSAGTATSVSDYLSVGLTRLTFSPGQTTRTVSVKIKGDTRDEQDETYFVVLSNPVGAVVADGVGQGTIIDDDPTPTLSVTNASIVEGTTNRTMTFKATLSTASGQVVSVHYATAPGTAVAPGDYMSTSGVLTFDPGQTLKSVCVSIAGDRAAERDETFFLNFFSQVNVVLATSQVTGTIVDDDSGKH